MVATVGDDLFGPGVTIENFKKIGIDTTHVVQQILWIIQAVSRRSLLSPAVKTAFWW